MAAPTDCSRRLACLWSPRGVFGCRLRSGRRLPVAQGRLVRHHNPARPPDAHRARRSSRVRARADPRQDGRGSQTAARARNTRLRCDARGCNVGFREELAAGVKSKPRACRGLLGKGWKYLERSLGAPILSQGTNQARIEAAMREARRPPFARRCGRVIGTDMLRMSPLLHVSSDGQEREQGSKDDPNANAHQRLSGNRN